MFQISTIFPFFKGLHFKYHKYKNKKRGIKCFAALPSPHPLFRRKIFLIKKKNRERKRSLAEGGVHLKECELQWGADVGCGRGWKQARKPGERGPEPPSGGGGAGRGNETTPRGPRGPGRPGAPPSLPRGGRAGGAAWFQPETRHLRPSPPPAPRAAAARVLPERLRPPRVDLEPLPWTYRVSSATFLTNRDVFGGRR